MEAKPPQIHDVFLEIETGRLWQVGRLDSLGGGPMMDIKTGDVRSALDLSSILYLYGDDNDGDPAHAFEFVGNFPNCDLETLEVLYGKRQSRWNY